MMLHQDKTLSMRALVCWTCLLVGVPLTSLGQTQEYFGVARSIRSLGMGGAYYALSNDEFALFYNPAGLAFYENGSQFMINVNAIGAPQIPSALKTIMDSNGSDAGALTRQLQKYQGKPLSLNAHVMPYFAKKNFAFGLLLGDTKLNLSVLGRELNTNVEATVLSDSGLFFGFASEMFSGLSVGATLKAMVRAGGTRQFSVVELAAGQNFDLNPDKIGGLGGGADFDLGAMYEVPGLPWGHRNRVSLVISNVLASSFDMFRIKGTAPGLPRYFSLGWLSEFPGYGWIDKVNVLMDFSEFGLGGQSNRVFGARGGAFFKHVNLGVEALIRRWVFLRLGFHQGYWTAGIGVDARFAKLDLATYQEEMSSSPGRLGSRRIALRLAFGVSGRAPRAVESATEATTEVKTEGKPETETTGGPKAPINPVENAVDVPAGKADVLGPGPKDENLGDDLKKENP